MIIGPTVFPQIYVGVETALAEFCHQLRQMRNSLLPTNSGLNNEPQVVPSGVLEYMY